MSNEKHTPGREYFAGEAPYTAGDAATFKRSA